ncbi:putative secreted protein (Por secretion system target) [Nonlabens dokdonensis]|uniref:Secreted protein (Por secretion system target) n=2 Tax=Nonlabens dokdonensis TaxID=328515 RepID=A0ABX5PV81_9FLAO|nr:T9SS type A sorting domain-containing protein [Nonlabens dokdonensis]AGC78154.1 putative extracellular nuclease [Nonlabens dokdonensis DSW-6]PZX37953.1 putative secreted protein (Por secretion system target) [Nonlabens dokdonensis]
MKNITQLSVIVVFFFISTMSFGQVVNKTVDDGTAGTLRVEIANAGTNGTVTFDSSIQGQTINVTNGEILVSSFLALTIDGNNGGTPTTISGVNSNRIFNFSSTIAASIAINDINFIDGEAIDGGAIAVSDATTVLSISDCEFRNNNATGSTGTNGGGAIFNNGAIVNINGTTLFNSNTASGISGSGGAILNSNGGTTTLDGSSFNLNSASRAGGAIEDNSGALGGLNINNSSFTTNSTSSNPGNGGAIHMTGAGNSSINSSSFTNNTASNEGGGLWNGSGVMTITGTTIDGNTASGSDAVVAGASGGGGIYNEGGTVTTDATTLITNNIADGAQGTGGGVLNANGVFTANGSTISGNSSNRAGGGIEQNQVSTTNLTDVTMSMNITGVVIGAGAPGNGGALHVSQAGTVNITDGTYTQNTAANEGGALWNGSGLMNIDGTTAINNNTANGEPAMGAMNPGEAGGGGIYNEGGAVVITGSVTVNNNNATGSTSTGGGILVAGGSLDATGTTITGNGANRAGGGIEANSGAPVILTNVSLDGNTAGVTTGAGAPGNGGGLHISGSSVVNVTGGTVSNNIAMSEGGGLWNGTGIMTVDGTTIDGNTASGDAADNGGGGIYALSNGTLEIEPGTTISNNTADGTSGSGGGILANGSNLDVDGATITGNSANRAGGGIEVTVGTSTTAVINNVTLNGNFAGTDAMGVTMAANPGSGGGMHVTGAQDVSVTGGTVNNNTAAFTGGGLWNHTGTMTVTGSTIDGNTASGAAATNGGGGIFQLPAGSLVVGMGTNITNNTADGASGSGGGILVGADGNLDVTGATISGNTSNRAGGGIEISSGTNAGTVSLTNTTLDNNVTGPMGSAAPGNGGGLHITGPQDITISDGSANGNIAANEGGGLWNGSGLMNLSGTLTVNNNTASGEASMGATNPGEAGGGGIYNEGGAVVITGNVAVNNNNATGSTSTGGGILVAGGSLDATGTTITGNGANRAGGGIEANSGAPVTLTNVSLDGNTAGVTTGAGAPGNGGGLHISGSSVVNVISGTVSNNIAMSEGGGLWNGTGTMTVDGVAMDGNTASGAGADNGGGAVYALNGGMVSIINGSMLTNNTANGTSGSGGAVLVDADASISIDGSTLNSNIANRAGGAIEIVAGTGTASLTNVTMNSNNAGAAPAVAAPGNGGALHITGNQDIVISNSMFSGNTAAREGGALWNGAGLMTITSSTIDANFATGNSADDGGAGIFNNGGDITADGIIVTNNLAQGSSASGGGVLSTDGIVSFANSTFTGNAANRAGGAFEIIDGSLSITDSDVSGNDVNGTAGTPAPGNGGAIHITGATTTNILRSTFNNNSAGREGGALWNQNNSTMTVGFSILDGNSAFGTDLSNDGGGAIFLNGGDFTITNSTISNNTATANGGGIGNLNGSLTVSTTTISGNSAGANGGGIVSTGPINVINAVTVARNSATTDAGGVGFQSATGSFTLKNTIVAENTSTNGVPDIGVSTGSYTSLGFNLIEIDDIGDFTPLATDIVGTTAAPEFAALGPLANNGGTTLTHALMDGTRAFDNGDSADTFADQIGQAVFGTRDIGAFESQVTLSNEEFVSEFVASRLYPNPATGETVQLELSPSYQSITDYRIIDMTGKTIAISKALPGVNNIQVNTFATGAYIIRVEANGQVETLRLLVD